MNCYFYFRQCGRIAVNLGLDLLSERPVMYSTNLIGFGLAVASSSFIGSSFIIKKKGLQRAGASGTRASMCFTYF